MISKGIVEKFLGLLGFGCCMSNCVLTLFSNRDRTSSATEKQDAELLLSQVTRQAGIVASVVVS